MPIFSGDTRRVLRAKPQLRVLSGYYPTEPRHLSYNAKPKDAEAILSGMVVLRDANDEFVKSVAADGTLAAAATAQAKVDAIATSVYIARQDQNELDVLASGNLTGLDCSGEYEFQTGYFEAAPASPYEVGTPLVPAAGGILTPLAELTSGDFGVVVGFVTKVGAEANGSINLGGYTPSASDNTVIQFKPCAPQLVVVP